MAHTNPIDELVDFQWMFYFGFAIQTVTSITIATSLCYSLIKRRSGVPRLVCILYVWKL